MTLLRQRLCQGTKKRPEVSQGAANHYQLRRRTGKEKGMKIMPPQQQQTG